MPIIVTVDVLLAKRKWNMFELSKRLNMSPGNLSKLNNGVATGITFSTLDALCTEFECQPGDILKHVSEEEYRKLMRS